MRIELDCTYCLAPVISVFAVVLHAPSLVYLSHGARVYALRCCGFGCGPNFFVELQEEMDRNGLATRIMQHHALEILDIYSRVLTLGCINEPEAICLRVVSLCFALFGSSTWAVSHLHRRSCSESHTQLPFLIPLHWATLVRAAASLPHINGCDFNGISESEASNKLLRWLWRNCWHRLCKPL